jgi:hypothetical protein
VSECDREASVIRRPWPTGGCCAIEKRREEKRREEKRREEKRREEKRREEKRRKKKREEKRKEKKKGKRKEKQFFSPIMPLLIAIRRT